MHEELEEQKPNWVSRKLPHDGFIGMVPFLQEFMLKTSCRCSPPGSPAMSPDLLLLSRSEPWSAAALEPGDRGCTHRSQQCSYWGWLRRAKLQLIAECLYPSAAVSPC